MDLASRASRASLEPVVVRVARASRSPLSNLALRASISFLMRAEMKDTLSAWAFFPDKKTANKVITGGRPKKRKLTIL